MWDGKGCLKHEHKYLAKLEFVMMGNYYFSVVYIQFLWINSGKID